MSRVVFGAILGLSKIAKPVSVMLQSGLAKQLVEADILLFIETERRFITRCSRLPVGYVCQFSVGIHIWLKKRVATRENATRPRRASTFVGQNAVCRTKVQLAVVWRQQKSAPEIFSVKTLKNLRSGFRSGLSHVQYYNRRALEQALGADWCGRKRTSKPKRYPVYIAAEIKGSVCEP